MLSLIWLLASLSAVLLLALLFLIWLLVTQARKASQAQTTALQQALSATSMTLVSQAEETRKALTESTAKALGTVTALADKVVSGTSSIATQQTATTDRLVTLLASKEPMAYSQLRQTDVALSPDQGTGPYPAADDAEWHRVDTEQEKADREEAARLEAEAVEWLQNRGVNVDATGFPAVDQGQ